MAATLPLLREKGREVSTREIAAAAGVAEGTIFRVFGAKQELIDAAVDAALDPADFVAALDAIDPATPLPQRLTEAVVLMQTRMRDVHQLMAAVGLSGPPPTQHACRWHEATVAGLTRLVTAGTQPAAVGTHPTGPHPTDDATQPAFRVDPSSVAYLLRMLTFAASHPFLSEGLSLNPEQIVDVLLHGVLAPAHPSEVIA